MSNTVLRLMIQSIAIAMLSACGGGSDSSVSERNANAQEEAKAEAPELTKMRAEAVTKGIVRASVVFERGIALFEVASTETREQGAARARAKMSSLMASLGGEVWRTVGFADFTQWGYAQMYVTRKGLEMLLMSESVLGVSAAPSNSRMDAGSGNLEAIEKALLASGEIDLDVALNVDAQDFSLLRNGSFFYVSSSEQTVQVKELRAALLANANPAQIIGFEEEIKAPPPLTPIWRLRVTREGYYMLRERPEVLSLRPAGWIDQRPFSGPTLAAARAHAASHDGQVFVMLSLRDAPASGRTASRAAQDRQTMSWRGIMDDVLSPIQAGVLSRQRDMEYFGVAVVRMMLPAFEQLIEANDWRLKYVELDVLVGSAGNQHGTDPIAE